MLILPLSFFLSSRGSLGKRIRIALKISLEKLFDASVQKLVMQKDRSTHCNLNTKEKNKGNTFNYQAKLSSSVGPELSALGLGQKQAVVCFVAYVLIW